jgi:hypothetical protein
MDQYILENKILENKKYKEKVNQLLKKYPVLNDEFNAEINKLYNEIEKEILSDEILFNDDLEIENTIGILFD